MTKRNGVVGLVGVLVLVGVVALFRTKVHFDWPMFWKQLRYVSAGHVVAGIALIYGTYWLRAVRWSVFLAPTKKVSAGSLLGSQFIGFSAVALFGRLADLTRPYLVARRVGLSLSSQVAVYTIERMFDLGAAAVIFSIALAFTPKELPHHEVFVRAGVVSLGATLAIAVFAGVVRVAGGAVADFARSVLGTLSKPAGREYCGEDPWVSRWTECDRVDTGVRRGGAVVAGDVGDDRRGVPADGACVCEYSGAGRADVFEDHAADGGEYWRFPAAASDYWVVYADRCDGDGDACFLWSSD